MGATPRSGALAPESPLVALSAGASDTSSAIGLPHAALGVWREGPSGSRVRSPPSGASAHARVALSDTVVRDDVCCVGGV